jgi:hypothetical protein
MREPRTSRLASLLVLGSKIFISTFFHDEFLPIIKKG